MTLDRYLTDVTAPFPPDTARRIRRDLEEHALADADALRGAGHPDPEGAAVAALGPVREVRQALEREHFTRAEEEALWATHAYRTAEVRSVPRLLLELLLALALGFLVPLLRGWDGNFAWTSYGAYALGVLCFQGLDWRIPRRLSSRSARVKLVLLRRVAGLFVFLALQVVWFPGPELRAGLVGGLLGAMLAMFTLHRRLWPYLPKALRNGR